MTTDAMTAIIQKGKGHAPQLLTAVLLIMLSLAAGGLLTIVDRTRSTLGKAAALPYLPKGEYLKPAVLGYRQLASDILWLQVIQQMGVRQQTAEGYHWIYEATDTLTELDPHFIYAYQAAGAVLGVWGNRPHDSIAILKKGLQHNPRTWELAFLLGYDYFYEFGDYASAAYYLKLSSELPGSPAYLPRLTARMLVEAGDPQAAMEFLERMYQATHDERGKAALRRRINDVTVERDLRVLEQAVRQFRGAHGQFPKELHDLIDAGIVAALPQDPGGGTYEVDPADGSVRSTRLSERMRVYRQH
jgi:tetratricopeptide (TPR) repeat protein